MLNISVMTQLSKLKGYTKLFLHFDFDATVQNLLQAASETRYTLSTTKTGTEQKVQFDLFCYF